MSAIIHHFVVHQLRQNDKQELVVVPKKSCFTVTPDIENLAQQINSAFNQKPGKGVGSFIRSEEAQGFSLQQSLKAGLVSDEDFVQFSQDCCEKLKQSLIETGSVETGFVIFCHYEFLATQYLMITLLNTKQHIEINSHLELAYRDHLDLAKMQLALRIDLTQWQISPEQNRYISFIKGRMGRKVSDFFMLFAGCEEQVDVKQQNKQLIKSVDEFIASEQLDKQEQHQTRQLVSEYYKSKLDQGEEINIAELSESLPKDHGQDFLQFNQSNESPLEATFQADPSALKTLAKFSGQGGGISLNFDRVLFGERVLYDAQTDTLTIQGIPPNLKDQLMRWNG